MSEVSEAIRKHHQEFWGWIPTDEHFRHSCQSNWDWNYQELIQLETSIQGIIMEEVRKAGVPQGSPHTEMIPVFDSIYEPWCNQYGGTN